jgi:hypothetical protein
MSRPSNHAASSVAGALHDEADIDLLAAHVWVLVGDLDGLIGNGS